MGLRTLPLPAGKIADAYDAGMAGHGTRDAVKLDGDGYPVINERTGEPRMERKRRAASVKYVTKSGTVVEVRIAPGSGQRPDAVRSTQVAERMHNAMAIKYHTCPIRDDISRKWLPREMRSDKPCAAEDFGRGKKYGRHFGCPHIEKLIAIRTAEHLSVEAKKSRNFKPDDVKADERQDRLVTELVTKVFAAERRSGS